MSDSRLSRLLNRRRAVVGLVSAGIASLAPSLASARQSPPIISRHDEQPSANQPSDQIIEPEPQPTIAPDEDSTVVLEQVEETSARYFAATGHNLAEPFLSAWTLGGGEALLGPPMSEPRYSADDGGIRQDFGPLALVHHPDRGDQGTITGVALPHTALKAIDSGAGQAGPGVCTSGASGCVVVESTGHTVSGALATFWHEHGGIQVIGPPLGEPRVTGTTTTQVFANAVLVQVDQGLVTFQPANAGVVAPLMATDPAFVPAPPTNGTSWLIRAEGGLNLRAGPANDAAIIATLPDNAEFIAAPAAEGNWAGGYVDGFSGWVSREYLTEVAPPVTGDTRDWRLDVWQGATLAETNVRRQPSTAGTSIRTLGAEEPVVVRGWVRGEAVTDNQITWAELEGGGFVYARNIRRAAPVAPPPLFAEAPQQGKWIDVHLTQQVMVAYEGQMPIRTMVTTTGMPGWETPPGWYAINTRVANETMESGSIGAENFYVLKDVLFTQYFTDRGHALHYAWWKNAETIGRPGSHGCLNLLLEDARFLWDWASIGTPVICRTEGGMQ